MKKRNITVIALLSLACTSHAVESARELADQLVALLRYDEQFDKYHEQCLATRKIASPEVLVSKNPRAFGEVQPGHSSWPAVMAAYENFYAQVCSRPTRDEFLSVLATSYAATLSATQIKDSIAFYSFESGRALIDAHRFAQASLYEAWTKINSVYFADLTAKSQREISDLSNRK